MDDSEIVALYNDRNENAIAATGKKYGKLCAGIARNILRNEQDAEECVNDTYLKVWEKIPPDMPKTFSAYLAKLTRNTAIDKYRRLHSEKRGGGEITLVLDELSECVSDKSSVEQTAERHETLAAVNRFLERLASKQRILFVSRYCYCESVHALAARFGMSENSVSVSLNRTRNRLREYLTKEGFLR